MKIARYLIAGLCLSALAGCTTQSTAPEAVPDVSCPVPEPCPVCEGPPEPEVCPEPQVVETIVEVPAPLPPMAETAGKLHLPIIGVVEDTLVEPAGLVVAASIDTGTETTAIHAEDIQLVEKEGRRYVRFALLDGEQEKVAQELPLRRRVSVTDASGDVQRYYVVRMWLTLGDTRSRIDVALVGRAGDEHPLLIGRNFLLDTAIVDVSRRHTQPTPESPAP